MDFKSDEHLECELNARINAGVVEDLSRTLDESVRLLKVLVAGAHRIERDYMAAEWHDAVDGAKVFLAAMMVEGASERPQVDDRTIPWSSKDGEPL